MSKADLVDLPDEVRQLITPLVANDPATLDAIGVAIAEKRDDAKTARTSSGIEEVWKESEEAYIGIDDANRLDFQNAKWAKPMSMDGPVTTERDPKATDHKSTLFVRLTARYVDAGSAKLGEILLPADDKAFSFSETPVPELIKAKEDQSQVYHEGLGVPLTRPAQPGEPPPGGAVPPALAPSPPVAAATPPAMPAVTGAAQAMGAAPGAPPMPQPQVPLTVADLAIENIEIARKKAKAAEQRIYDWMVECQYQANMRKVIDDSARIGVGVLKAPVPKSKKELAITKASGGGVDIQLKYKLKPTAMWLDPWNVFPDPACGENIHNGDFVFERDWMTRRQVTDLKRLPGYLKVQIDKVLLEGPDENAEKDDDLTDNPNAKRVKGRFEIWYYYGSLKREEVIAIGTQGGDKEDIPEDQKEVFVIVTLINKRVVRCTINPLDSGSFPYHSVPWQRRAGHWAGIGIAEQIKTPQKMINGATRAMLNNAGKSAGSQIVVNRAMIRPMDGSWIITPDKIWELVFDSDLADVEKAFAIHEIPNVTDELMKIVEYALKLAEESTSIPLITQGQTGETQPQTLGATNIQNSNANQLLRAIGYAFDDYITEPVVRQFYEWLLIDPEVPDDEKGDFTINAHGSIALVERAIQDQTIAQMGAMAANPIYGVDPKKWATQFFKSKHLNPEDMQYTPEEQAKIDAAPKPAAPAVEAAKVNADTQIKIAVMKDKQATDDLAHDQRVAQASAIIDGGRVDAEDRRTLAEHTVKLHEIETQRQLAVLQYANQHRMKIADVHAHLLKGHLDRAQRAAEPPIPPPEIAGKSTRRNRPEVHQ